MTNNCNQAVINYKFFQDSACSILDNSLTAQKDGSSISMITSIASPDDFVSYVCPYYVIEQEGTGAIFEIYKDIFYNPNRAYSYL